MQIARTPEARFEGLVDYPFEPHYVEVGDDPVRVHYVDEGPRDGAVVLMLHGEPTWSYLYRHMIADVVREGCRAIAPDLVGFGKSDKPTRASDYSFASHVGWMSAFLEQLDLSGITLFGQDWGSLIGLRLVGEHEERFARVVIGNGMLPTGDRRVPAAFHAWRLFAARSPWFPIGRIVAFGTKRKLSVEERRAYDAPFPSAEHLAGARAFPALVPTRPDDPASEANRRAWEVLEKWEKPFLTLFGDGDPIMRGADHFMQKRIPGCEGQPHQTLHGNHFIQEDAPHELARAIVNLVKRG